MKGWLGFGAVAAAMLVAACGNGITSKQFATLEAFTAGRPLAVGGTITVSSNGIAAGEEKSVAELRLINTGEKNLDISSITIASTPPDAFRLASDPTTLAALSAGPHTVVPQAEITGDRNFYAYIIYKRPTTASTTTPSAVITVVSNNVDSDGQQTPEVKFNIGLEGGAPVLQALPATVDFDTVAQGSTKQKTINLLNPGNDTLLVDGFSLSGHPNFELVVGADHYKVSPETSTGITLDEPLEIAPGDAQGVTVLYTASGPEEATGNIVFASNDPAQPSGTRVELQANVGGPCISVSPKKVDFGGKLIGKVARVDLTITSCGDKPLSISEIALLPDGSEEYTLALESLPGLGGAGPVGALGPADPPIVLNPNQTAKFSVEYLPQDLSPVDGTGLPVRDIGTIRIKSNSFADETKIDVSGFGVDKECPTPVIVIPEGEEVVPQTVLHLVGSQSFAATGSIASYQWRVSQPIGSQSVFQPSATVADPKFEVNVAGRYEFELSVTDSTGEPSCAPARVEVFVNPDEAIHIELLWDTPNDPDQTNIGPEAGADLDLHFLHPFAVGTYDGDKDGQPDGYFDSIFDCFWFHPNPNWGDFDAAVDDDPSLDRDDTDGAGPENVNLNLPEAGNCYRVGVHYWNDHSFGKSNATLRVYVYSNLVFEMTDVELVNHDLWTVTKVCWPPDGNVPELVKVCEGTTNSCQSAADCGGAECGLRIAHDYVHPLFPTD
ncbi:MAG: choice-of-anchor D domain-containing protein [Myxococcota bacterium]